jgi:hypothetical protein
MRPPAGVWNQNIITWIQNGLHCKIISMDAAMRDQYLSLWIVGNAIIAT